MRKIRRRCKNPDCREWFHPGFQNQTWCSPECGTVIALAKREKDRHKAIQEAERRQKEEAQQERRNFKVRKLAVQPRSYWIKQAQQAVNSYVRERDRNLPCVSCGTMTAAQFDAGHYRTTAAAPQLRFDPRQIWKQCSVCNQHKSGNIPPYRIELIKRIGLAEVESIEGNHDRHRWTIEECKAIKAEYQAKLKQLIAQREAA